MMYMHVIGKTEIPGKQIALVAFRGVAAALLLPPALIAM